MTTVASSGRQRRGVDTSRANLSPSGSATKRRVDLGASGTWSVAAAMV
jgi:hypothetical protein